MLWGLQFAFLTPVLAILLVTEYQATPEEVGWILAGYNASGFVASLIFPAAADRHADYLKPQLLCALFSLATAVVLTFSSSTVIAAAALIMLGGPGVAGMTLLFAQVKQSAASDVSYAMRIRAVFSFAWVGAPPVATLLMAAMGNRAVAPAMGFVAVINIAAITFALARSRGVRRTTGFRPPAAVHERITTSKVTVFVLATAFVAAHAANSSAVASMGLFVTHDLASDVIWVGIVLGVSAALEIPALMLIGRLSRTVSEGRLLASGCLAGLAYFLGMTLFAHTPVTALVLQVLNAWFFGTIAGTGLAVFQRIIPRPGLASGLYSNTNSLGSILAGGVIAFAAATSLGYRGIFTVCAALLFLSACLLVVVFNFQLKREARVNARPEQVVTKL